uniref:Uncharacterized protein n=1 Tax=Romanomermis culicivorax TaxID=13658 RepID=A0A915HGH3_ROMCU
QTIDTPLTPLQSIIYNLLDEENIAFVIILKAHLVNERALAVKASRTRRLTTHDTALRDQFG